MKKLVAIALAVLSINTAVYAEFDDMKGHWAADDVHLLADQGIIKGVTINEFKPDNVITRAEFLALTARAAGFKEVKYRQVFNDVADGSWYANTLQTCFDNCLIDVVMMDGGYIKPNLNITREEAVSVIVKAFDTLGGKRNFEGDIQIFKDKESISIWAVPYVRAGYGLDFIKGKLPDEFAPKSELTRAEAAVIVKRFAEKSADIILANKQAQLAGQNKQNAAEEETQKAQPEQSDSVTVGEQISYGPEFAGTVIYTDDFEKYSSKEDLKNSKWKITENGATVDVIKVNDVSKAVVITREKEHDNNTQLQLNITPQSGLVAIEQKMMSQNATKEEGRLAILGSDGNYATNVMFHKNGLLVNRADPSTGASAWEQVAPFTPGRWYDVRLLIDTKAGTFDVYVDGVLKGDDWKLRTKVPNVAKILNFIFGDSKGGYHFDDFKITSVK